MSSEGARGGRSVRLFFITLIIVDAAAGLIASAYFSHLAIPPAAAAAIITAFLLQISFYLLFGFVAVRRTLEETLTTAQLGALVLGGALLPYLIYSVPTQAFRLASLVELAATTSVPAFVYVLWPARGERLTWQDLVALAPIAVLGFTGALGRIYLDPGLYSSWNWRSVQPVGHIARRLGSIMTFGVAPAVFLSLRKIRGTRYRFGMSVAEWKVAIKNFALFLPIGALLAVGLRLIRFHPADAKPMQVPLLAFGAFWASMPPALFEELLFRGILQNLLTRTLERPLDSGPSFRGRPLDAQLAVSLLFGASFVRFGVFPNWNLAIVAAVAGWFCGQAYREQQSVVASCITHALIFTAIGPFDSQLPGGR